MNELREFRNYLGPAAAEYDDVQLAELRREMQAMAKLLLDIYLYKKTQKCPAKDFDASSDLP